MNETATSAPSSQSRVSSEAASSNSPQQQKQQTPKPAGGMSTLAATAPSAAPSSQTPGHPSFRRQRASRACETCHARKVRCDAASLGVPCTNCVAFSIECKIPAPKRKKGSKAKDDDSNNGDEVEPTQGHTPVSPPEPDRMRKLSNHVVPEQRGTFGIQEYKPDDDVPANNQYAQVMKPKFVRAPIKEAGRVAYLGESSNLSLLVHDRHGTTDVVHYPLPENIRGARARMDELDHVEIEILHQRGAFLLPPRGLCDELVDAFFKWIAPVCPVVNKSRFMRSYRDSKNPPSLLLLQAILLAGSRVCNNPQLMDTSGSTTPAAMTFYKRAKALFDANYEDDRVTIVQALILMGWYWEGPEDVTKNVFYWTRVAATVAQGSGMHRSVESSQLSKPDKRLWKRIWWTLFTRDRSVAVALGRPCLINTEDSDVEMISEDDFVEDELDRPADYTPEPVHVQFFLNYVKLCEIMGLVLSQQYSAASKMRKRNALDLTHSDMALAEWLQNCPKEVFWEKPTHHFWAALLHANYYTTLCLLHRAHMPPAGTPSTVVKNGVVIEAPYPSRNIAYQAAGMITSIIESLRQHDQLRYAPAFIVYSLFSALIMHVYQMRSANSAIVQATEQRLQICMQGLKEVSKTWLVAKMVHTLFESILGNKALEERLQKAGGKRAHKHKTSTAATNSSRTSGAHEAQKRKLDEVDSVFPNGPPAPQMSYERSRPVTPSATPSRELPPPHPGMPNISTNSPSPSMAPRQDAFMGSSRNATRPTTPFQPHIGHSVPGTPPDLFLVTKNSPGISQDVINNFAPDQLFPPDPAMSMSYPNISPSQPSLVDPQLSHLADSPNSLQHAAGHQHQQQQQQPHQQPQHHLHPASAPAKQTQFPPNVQQQQQQQPQPQQPQPQQMQDPGFLQHDPHDWGQLGSMLHRPPSNDDTWSQSSTSQGQSVPMTFNVEDWIQFFGMNGGLESLPAFQ